MTKFGISGQDYRMKNNMIIFTTGSSGSSVLTGLIATQGYWLGDETKQLNFDTYENAELVDLNIRILKESGFRRIDCNDIPPPSIEKIKLLKKTIDPTDFKKFVQKCNQNKPWIWKDPRLSYTIHFWDQFEEVKKSDVLFVSRDALQSYAGLIISRKVPMSYSDYSKINSNYFKSYKKFVKSNQIHDFKIGFEDLILKPEESILSLNERFSLNISFEDLKKTYKGKLYQKRYGRLEILKSYAYFIFYKYFRKEAISFPRG